MADKASSQFVVRCDEWLPPALDAAAAERGVSRNRLVVDVLEAAISPGAQRPSGDIDESEFESGDITTERTPDSAFDAQRATLPVLQLSSSELQCMDQLAGRAGVERVMLMERYLRERLRREFVEDRQRNMENLRSRAGRKGAGSAQENDR